MSNRQSNVVVNEGTVDQKITVHNSVNNLAANEKLVKVKPLITCSNETIVREMGNIVDTVED